MATKNKEQETAASFIFWSSRSNQDDHIRHRHWRHRLCRRHHHHHHQKQSQRKHPDNSILRTTTYSVKTGSVVPSFPFSSRVYRQDSKVIASVLTSASILLQPLQVDHVPNCALLPPVKSHAEKKNLQPCSPRPYSMTPFSLFRKP